MDNSSKSKVDPGWNDPPMLNYNASNPPPKSRIANKRVAFPLNGSTSAVSQVPTANLPPLPVRVFSVENTKEQLGKFFTVDESKEHFFKQWDSELSDECKKTICLMTECLVRNNMTGAELHKDTLLAHSKTCESWLKDVKF